MLGSERPPLLLCVVVALVLTYLVVPSLIVIVMSFSGGLFLEFPPRVVSFRWHETYWASQAWRDATVRSVKIGVLVTVLATAIGTMASLVRVRPAWRGRSLLNALILSPIIVPTIVLSIGIYSVYARWRLIGTTLGLVLAHTLLGLPFVVLNVSAVLLKLDRALDRAARIHGAGPFYAFRQVTLPLIWPGMAAGAILAFLTSFDEIVIAMFVSGGDPTLPKLMFDGIRYELEPGRGGGVEPTHPDHLAGVTMLGVASPPRRALRRMKGDTMDARHVSRRRFLTLTAASLGAALARPVPGRAGAGARHRWLGAHEESLKKAVYDPFTAATGIRIKQTSATEPARHAEGAGAEQQPGVGRGPARQLVALAWRQGRPLREGRLRRRPESGPLSRRGPSPRRGVRGLRRRYRVQHEEVPRWSASEDVGRVLGNEALSGPAYGTWLDAARQLRGGRDGGGRSAQQGLPDRLQDRVRQARPDQAADDLVAIRRAIRPAVLRRGSRARLRLGRAGRRARA
jgi:putative spermidine/putrescine transport system permease protein